MKKNFIRIVSLSLIAAVVVLAHPAQSYADTTPTLTATQTVANVPAGNTDQTDATVTGTPNVVGVHAARTLSVNSIPVASTTSQIGSCVITYSTSTADALSCSGNAAIINVTTHNATTTIAATIRSLTSVSDSVHGALAITGTTTTATFTSTATTTSATNLTFSDGTTGAVTSGTPTTGVIPVAQVNTITIGGTPEAGDIFTATLPTVGAVSYTAISSDTTNPKIANGLRTAIVGSAGYSTQGFTAATSTNTVVFTAKVAGVGFTQTSSTTNYPGVAQRVTFTPANVLTGYEYMVTINGTRYTSTSNTVDQVVADLATALATDPSVTCTQDGSMVTCTANVAGTSFTYDASATYVQHHGGGHSGGGSSGGGSSSSSSSSSTTTTGGSTTTTTTSGDLNAQLSALLAQVAALQAQMGVGGSVSGSASASAFARDLTMGSTGSDVMALQVWLNAHGFMVAASGAGAAGSETTTFGPATQAALAKYQASVGITPAAGYFGAKTRAYLASH